MLGLAEYRANAAVINTLAKQTDLAIRNELTPDISKQEAISIATRYAEEYWDKYENTLKQALEEISENATDYYGERLLIDDDALFAMRSSLVDVQYEEPYYGATLRRRLDFNKARLMSNIVRSAQVGPIYVGGTFSRAFPFGAQSNIDVRLLQATGQKLEQDAAVATANHAEVPLIKWNLSPRHNQPCDCEYYAKKVSDDVVEYLKEHNLSRLDPTGLYFTNELPRPPHPFCQCEFGHRTDKGTSGPGGAVRRTVRKIRSLIKRIRGR